MSSIRRQLLIWLLGGVIAAGLSAAYAVYSQSRHEVDQLFDYQLRQLAVSMRDRTFERREPLPAQLAFEFDFVMQVWNVRGERVYASHAGIPLPRRTHAGYDTVTAGEGAWRVYAVEHRGFTLQVAQPLAVRGRLATQAALRTLTPFVVLAPVLAILIWFVVGRTLRPLASVARAVERRTPSALEPLPTQGLPAEALPLVASLNDLLARLEHALASQRRFVADAAHELRTPLTALALQIQLVERATTDAARAEALRTLRAGAERSAHLVQQLLTLARQEPEAPRRTLEAVRLDELARRVVGEYHLLAEERGIDLGIARDEPAEVTGDPEGLHVALRNLVDNAVRYTPEDGRVDVSVRRTAQGAELEVVDTGPGIPAEDRERVFARFYRRPGSAVPGSGLGLSIVREIARAHGGRIVLLEGPGGRGLLARLELPAESPAQTQAPA